MWPRRERFEEARHPMVHLIAAIANDAEYMPALLYALRGEVRLPEPAVPGETWGVGYFADGRGLIVRKPASILEERSAYGIGRNLKSRIVMACARSETEQADAPPFRFRRWLFGYTGRLDGLGILEDQLTPRLPDFVRDGLGDGHGGRLAHAMFLTELHRAGALEDPLADPLEVGRALERTAETLARLAPEAGVENIHTSFVASDGRVMAVTRAGRPLWMREISGLDRLPEGPIDDTLHDFKRIAEALRQFRARVVALEVDPEVPGWQPLGTRGSTVFARDLAVHHVAS